MVDYLQLSNMMLFTTQLTPEVVRGVTRLPELFRVQFLGLEVFREMASLGPAFARHLGRILTLAQVTYLETVPASHLQLVAGLIARHESDAAHAVFRGMISEALRLNNVQDFDITLLEPVEGWLGEGGCLFGSGHVALTPPPPTTPLSRHRGDGLWVEQPPCAAH